METIDAIVLKVAPYSETTLLLTLLTRDHGLVRALAKGVRRKGPNVQAAFEPFAWIQASLRLKSPDGLGAIFYSDLREGWAYLRHDMDRLAYAGLGLEVLGALAGHSPPEADLFEEAVRYLGALRLAAGPGSLAIALLLRLLHCAGFPPQLAQPWTAETLPPTVTYHFERGMFDQPRPEDSLHTLRLSRAAMVPLLSAIRTPPPLDGSFAVGAQAGVQILRWLIRVWQDHLNQPLKAAIFIEKMVLRPQ